METWLIYALLSVLFGGMLAFGMKTISAKNLNVHFVSGIAYVVVLVISSVYYYLFEISSFNPESFLTILILGFINSALFYGSIVTRVYGLRNIDTTIFFPLYMTFLPIIITLASVLLYKEVLNIYEWIGVGLGISVPLLLITKREFGIQKNLKLGIIFMLATSLLAISSAIFPKELHNMGYSVDLYVIVSAFFGVIFATVAYHLSKDRNSSVKKKIPFKHIGFAIILGCIQYAAFISFIRALSGNMAIVITINSFNILIPIILSVIFYKEEMTKKKAFVIFLSIVSVILFI